MSAYGGSSVTNRSVGQASKDDYEVERSLVDNSGEDPDTSKPNSGSASKTGIKLSGRRDAEAGLASCARITLLAGILAAAVIIVYQLHGSQVSIVITPPVFEDQLPSILVSDKVLHGMLEASEQQYRANVAARLLLKKGVLQVATIDIREFKEDWLLPLYPCPLEGRFGFWGEGGKWVCLRHHAMRRPPLVISVGSKGDKSFEEELSTRLGGFSHTFDFSLAAEEADEMESYPFLKFYKSGLWGSGQKDYYRNRFPNATFLTVPEMLKAVGASYVDIFKIDCEGCEHQVVEDLVRLYTRDTVPFGQILMEIHWLGKTDVQLTTLLSLEKLGYRMFHTEVNAFWEQGYEIAFIHDKLVDPQL